MVLAFTRADYDRLPEGFPAELVHGQLVREPAPVYGHQYFVARVFRLLAPLVPAERLLTSPVDVVIDEFNVFQPDLVVLRHVPAFDVRDVGIPLLAVEVLSPSTERRDRGVKMRRLLAAGVGEVWLVHPRSRTVEVHDGTGMRGGSGSEPLASNVVPGFVVDPRLLFASSAR